MQQIVLKREFLVIFDDVKTENVQIQENIQPIKKGKIQPIKNTFIEKMKKISLKI